jgi:hypothetical protein
MLKQMVNIHVFPIMPLMVHVMFRLSPGENEEARKNMNRNER